MNDLVGSILQNKFYAYCYILLSSTRRCTPICGPAMLLTCNRCRSLAAVNCRLHWIVLTLSTKHTRKSSCMTLLWLHHNHKMSISYHKNGLVGSHESVGIWFIFMCFVTRISWWNKLAINSLLVSVSRWNSWLEPIRFHVNCVQFLRLLSFMWGRHNCVRKMVFRFTCVVQWKLHGQHRIFGIAAHVCNCTYSSV